MCRRGAAQRSAGPPIRYRAIGPDTLLLQLSAEAGERLERLSRSLQGRQRVVDPVSRPLEGTRPVATVIQHLVARASERIDGVLTAELWGPTLPAWRRAAGRASIHVRLTGEDVDTGGLLGTGAPAEHPTLLLVDDRHTLLAVHQNGGHSGLWSSDPLLMLLGKRALGLPR